MARVTHADEWVTKWIPEGGMNLPLVGLLTLILWASSYIILKAERSLEHNDLGGYCTWIHLWEKGFTISAHMYGTGFYTLTGVHAFHVIVGIGMQLILLINSGKALGKVTLIKAASYYWHFVDLAWLLVAGTAYIARFLRNFLSHEVGFSPADRVGVCMGGAYAKRP